MQIGPGGTAQPVAEERVVQDRQPGKQQVLLRHQRDLAVRARSIGSDGSSRLQPRHQPQQAGLADAGRAEQAGPGAALELQVQSLQEGTTVVKELGDCNLDRWSCRRGRAVRKSDGEGIRDDLHVAPIPSPV